MPKRLRTFVSPVKCRVPDGGLADLLDDGGRPVCWLDCLFDGGVLVPDDVEAGSGPPLLWLVTGPPGIGKTLFFLELCYRMATQPQDDGNTVSTFFFSAESPAGRLGQNMRDLGWEYVVDAQLAQSPLVRAARDGDRGGMWAAGTEITATPPLGPPAHLFQRLSEIRGLSDARVVVIDSLNMLRFRWDAEEVLKALRAEPPAGIWILILIQDWARGNEPYFAFMPDIETRFEQTSEAGYMLRTFQIVKMRWQEHAQGRHVLKVYGKPKDGMAQAAATGHLGLDREQGGVYVLPSIHRHLGAIRPARRANAGERSRLEAVDVAVKGMSAIMPVGPVDPQEKTPGGFPKGRCTAIVGDRGALKSHLAYCTLLRHLEQNPQALGVMFSLRDDERAALDALEQICGQEGICDLGSLANGANRRLDIVYFHPGYIPPAEFMHRVVVAIDGLVQRHGEEAGRDVIVVLNGLDHLAARHPLCAAEDMFVPALIAYLCEREVTSLVVAATDQPAPQPTAGLLPMADLLLRLERVSPFERRPDNVPESAEQLVRIVAQRVPSGGTSGRWGILYRDRERKGCLGFALQ